MGFFWELIFGPEILLSFVGIFWVLLAALGIFLGFDCWPHSSSLSLETQSTPMSRK